MPGLDPETLERAARWCADAGRPAGRGALETALGALSWDELLAARALLAAPPPARPLGPFALADLARGVPLPEVQAREAAGAYPPPADERAAPAAAAPPRPAAARSPPRARVRRPTVIVRKARAAPPPAAPAPPPPLIDELLLPAGRADLERLFRLHGGRRARLLAAVAAGHRRADGAPPSDQDLDRLLVHHGLARAYERRERDQILHEVRAASGVLGRAAAALGVTAAALGLALDRLAVREAVERIRDARRTDLRARVTLSERARLLVADADRLADLGLDEEFARDLRARLPDHLRALGGIRGPVDAALGESLSIPTEAVAALAARIGLSLDRPAARSRTAAPARAPGRPVTRTPRAPAVRGGAGRPAPVGARARGDARSPRGRPSPGRPSQGRPSQGRPSPGRPSPGRPPRR